MGSMPYRDSGLVHYLFPDLSGWARLPFWIDDFCGLRLGLGLLEPEARESHGYLSFKHLLRQFLHVTAELTGLGQFPEAANIRLKALRGLFKWATENAATSVTRNPAREVAKLRVREDGYHSWTETERKQFEDRHPVGTKARLAYALLFHTG